MYCTGCSEDSVLVCEVVRLEQTSGYWTMLRTEDATKLQVNAIRGAFQRVLTECRLTCHGKLCTTESLDIIFMVAHCSLYITFTRSF